MSRFQSIFLGFDSDSQVLDIVGTLFDDATQAPPFHLLLQNQGSDTAFLTNTDNPLDLSGITVPSGGIVPVVVPGFMGTTTGFYAKRAATSGAGSGVSFRVLVTVL